MSTATGYQDRINAMKKPGRRLPIFLASHPTPPATRDRHASDSMQHSRHWHAETRSRVGIYETKVSRVCVAVCTKGRIGQCPLNVMDDSGDVTVTVPSSVRTKEPQLEQLCFVFQHISKRASELHSACVALASRRAVSGSGERCMSRYASSPDVIQDPCTVQ
jgi:hypothetical protein